MSRLLRRSLAAVALCLACAPIVAGPTVRPFAVITAPGATDRRLSRETVALIFTRRQTYWDNGTRIQPVNLPADHPLRRAFSQTVLGHPPEAMEEYWRDMYFHGILPPHVVASEEAVFLFVSSTPGAVGYVSACMPDRQVTVVLVVGDLPGCSR